MTVLSFSREEKPQTLEPIQASFNNITVSSTICLGNILPECLINKMMPKVFIPGERPIEYFIEDYEHFAAILSFSNIQKCLIFKKFLNDASVLYLLTLSDPTRMNWSFLKTAFIERYHDPIFIYRLKRKLLSVRQLQSLSDYIIEFSTLTFELTFFKILPQPHNLKVIFLDGLLPRLRSTLLPLFYMLESWEDLARQARKLEPLLYGREGEKGQGKIYNMYQASSIGITNSTRTSYLVITHE